MSLSLLRKATTLSPKWNCHATRSLNQSNYIHQQNAKFSAVMDSHQLQLHKLQNVQSPCLEVSINLVPLCCHLQRNLKCFKKLLFTSRCVFNNIISACPTTQLPPNVYYLNILEASGKAEPKGQVVERYVDVATLHAEWCLTPCKVPSWQYSGHVLCSVHGKS